MIKLANLFVCYIKIILLTLAIIGSQWAYIMIKIHFDYVLTAATMIALGIQTKNVLSACLGSVFNLLKTFGKSWIFSLAGELLVR